MHRGGYVMTTTLLIIEHCGDSRNLDGVTQRRRGAVQHDALQ
jgi:hypothetical protein